MQIGDKIFPYPLLNGDKKLSDYNNEASFKISFFADNENRIWFDNNKLVF